jgi:hypothetical protein
LVSDVFYFIFTVYVWSLFTPGYVLCLHACMCGKRSLYISNFLHKYTRLKKNKKTKALAPLHFICLFLFFFFSLIKAHQIALSTVHRYYLGSTEKKSSSEQNSSWRYIKIKYCTVWKKRKRKRTIIFVY